MNESPLNESSSFILTVNLSAYTFPSKYPAHLENPVIWLGGKSAESKGLSDP